MILLKNNSNTLPIKSSKKIAVFGNTSYNFIAGGTGSGDVNKAYTVSLLQGLANTGYTIDTDIKNVYTEYLTAQKKLHPQKSFLRSL